MNLKNMRAFSLAEMMVVMLILSIVAAATLPIITKRSHSSDSVWQWSSNNSDAYFGLSSTQGAVIGASGFASGDATSKLMLNTSALGPNHIMFKQGDVETGHLVVDNSGNVGLGSVDFLGVAPPTAPTISKATAIGSNAYVGDSGTAIGANARSLYHGVAIGEGALGSNNNGFDQNTAIGYNALPLNKGRDNTAIGTLALPINSTGSSNIAIGLNACQYVTGSNKICIGNNSGPQSETTEATDTNEDIYIGSKSKFNNNNALLEVHNRGGSDGRAVVIVNGDFVVRGRTFINDIGTASMPNPSAVWIPSDGFLKKDGSIPGGFAMSSDRRLKNVGSDFNSGLDKVRALHVFNYTFKKDKDKTPRVGVMAQDLQKVFPDAVKKDRKGFLMIRQEDMFYAMMNSIKQLDKIVQGLVSDVKALVIKVQKIDDKIAAVIKVDQINSQKIKKLETENAQLKTQNKAFETRLKRLEKKIR